MSKQQCKLEKDDVRDQHMRCKVISFPMPTRNEDKLTRVMKEVPVNTPFDSLHPAVQHASKHMNKLCSLEHAVEVVNGEVEGEDIRGPIRNIYEAGVALFHSAFLTYAREDGNLKAFCAKLDREAVVPLLRYNSALSRELPIVKKLGVPVMPEFSIANMQPEDVEYFNNCSDKCNEALKKLPWDEKDGAKMVEYTMSLFMLQSPGYKRVSITHIKDAEIRVPFFCGTCFEKSGAKHGCKACGFVTCYNCRGGSKRDGLDKCPDCKKKF